MYLSPEKRTTGSPSVKACLCDVHLKLPPAVVVQTYQSSPGGHSSCSSEPSPLGSTNNNDSGVEMAMHSGGSFGDLSAQDESPMVDSTVPAGGQQAGVGLHLRKAVAHSGAVTIKLENIKKERLKTVSASDWVGSAGPPLQAQRSSVALPPIPAVGESQPRPAAKTTQRIRPHSRCFMLKSSTTLPSDSAFVIALVCRFSAGELLDDEQLGRFTPRPAEG